MNPEALSSDIDQAEPFLAQLTSLVNQLTDLRNRRDALYVGMWNKVKRVRIGVKSYYGDDSSAYELVGGTRLSERKVYRRRSG